MGDDSRKFESKTRLLGNTEENWCKAVAGGTGITTVALQVSKDPNISLLQKALHKIQNDHPILKSMLHKNPSTGDTAFVNPATPRHLHLRVMSPAKTADLLRTLPPLAPLHAILEHELNTNEWSPEGGSYVWSGSVYMVAEGKWVLVLRVHTVVCDRTAAVSLMTELKEAMAGGGGAERGIGYKEEVNMGIEDLIPMGKAKKTLWAHGKDMLTYSVNSLKLTNLKFKDVKGTRHSEVVRLKLNLQETQLLLAGCKSREIKLCGVLAAATLIAVHSSKCRSNKRKKYGVVFLNDCRSLLQPRLSIHNFGFYHSALSTIHEVKGVENLWDLATRAYMTFTHSKHNEKHFSDMADLNYLMSKVIDNPSLTPSSSLRSSLVTVFEEPIVETSGDAERDLGLEDYIGCSSIHGIGPSIALFDTIRDGRLDCACVYPSPLHSREQMLDLVASMKMSLVGALNMEEKV